MSFTLHQALSSDAEEIGYIMRSTIPFMPRGQLELKDVSQADILAFTTASRRADFATCARNPEKLAAVKAVEDITGKIVGYGIWGWSRDADEFLIAERKKSNIPSPVGANAALNKEFYSKLLAMETEYVPSGPYYSLLFLCTSPAHQRRGIGALVVQYGLAKAAKDRVPVYLSASPMGLSVYRKQGFVELGRLEIDLAKFGFEGEEKDRVHVHVAMVKEPEPEPVDNREAEVKSQ